MRVSYGIYEQSPPNMRKDLEREEYAVCPLRERSRHVLEGFAGTQAAEVAPESRA